MTDWHERLTAPVQAAEHGVAVSDAQFGSTHTGPLNFDRIDYPAAQVYVETVDRIDPTNWQFDIATTLYYEWDRDTDFTEDIAHPLAAVIEATLAALSDVECITDYHPSRIDFFAGEPTSGLVLAVAVQFRVRSLFDPGEFGT